MERMSRAGEGQNACLLDWSVVLWEPWRLRRGSTGNDQGDRCWTCQNGDGLWMGECPWCSRQVSNSVCRLVRGTNLGLAPTSIAAMPVLARCIQSGTFFHHLCFPSRDLVTMRSGTPSD